MAYYFNEVLMVSLDTSQLLQYIYLKMLPDKWAFKTQMRELEAKFKIAASSSAPSTVAISENNNYSNTTKRP